MNEMTKESKFLDAINKYAESQKAKITQEIEEYKNSRIEQATEQGLQDAYELIRGEAAKRKSAIVNDVAKRELELRHELYAERQRVFDDVFTTARERLTAFAKSDDYKDFLKHTAEEAKKLFGDEKCTIYLAPFDEDKKAFLSAILPEADFDTDNRITLGGIRVFCKAKGVMIDDTLDSRLADQEQWFIENSGLEVV